jgi:hypothetical protein
LLTVCRPFAVRLLRTPAPGFGPNLSKCLSCFNSLDLLGQPPFDEGGGVVEEVVALEMARFV